MFGSFESHYFTFEFRGDIVVARCVLSNVSEEENIDAIGQELSIIVGKYECRRLILDLVDVEYVTSSLVGHLIRIHRQMHRNQGKLVLCHLNASVDDILRTSHLLTYFNAAYTLDEAVALFEDVPGGTDSNSSDADDDHDPLDDTVDESSPNEGASDAH